jgi:hypothetical protein
LIIASSVADMKIWGGVTHTVQLTLKTAATILGAASIAARHTTNRTVWLGGGDSANLVPDWPSIITANTIELKHLICEPL